MSVKIEIKDQFENVSRKVRFTLERWQYGSTGRYEWNIFTYASCFCDGETLTMMCFDDGRKARAVFNGMVKGYS